jgi:hypothetical protein
MVRSTSSSLVVLQSGLFQSCLLTTRTLGWRTLMLYPLLFKLDLLNLEWLCHAFILLLLSKVPNCVFTWSL